MKCCIAMMAALTALTVTTAAQADVQICNLNTAYGYGVDGTQVRVTNDKGRVLSVSKEGLSVDGKTLMLSTDHAALESALREAIPAAAEVSRLAYQLSLGGLSQEFYSRHPQERWVPYVRAYRAEMLKRYDSAVQIAPQTSIARGSLEVLSNQIHSASRKGLTGAELQAFKPEQADRVSLDSERDSLNAFAARNEMDALAASMCAKVKAVEAAQPRSLSTAGIAPSFRIALTGSR